MSDLFFREIHLDSEPEIAVKFVSLVESELGGVRQLATIKRTMDYETGSAKVMGAFLDGELVSVNAFMMMKFFAGSDSYIGYQSGFSATSGSHRGKGIWPKLLNFSERYLSDLGASFIFGFPNPISHPVFVKKLRYRSTELYNFRVVCLPVLARLSYTRNSIGNHVTHAETILEPDCEFNISWKRRALVGSNVVSFTFGDSIIWGIVRSTVKYRVGVKYLEVGGLSLRSTSELPGLLAGAAKAVDARYCRISLNKENVYFPLFRMSNNMSAPVIIKSLTGSFVPEQFKLNFFKGLSDVF